MDCIVVERSRPECCTTARHDTTRLLRGLHVACATHLPLLSGHITSWKFPMSFLRCEGALGSIISCNLPMVFGFFSRKTPEYPPACRFAAGWSVIARVACQMQSFQVLMNEALGCYAGVEVPPPPPIPAHTTGIVGLQHRCWRT